ncbi:MAG: two pore domain potassium channel family protein [Gammaproteobacteria bacterium]|nr:two pore domain potassium channel family protein [Gammaproteobacteria bacterium]
MSSFIVEFWSSVFGALGRVSLFALVRWAFPSWISARFIDAWVLGHLMLAFAALVIVSLFPTHVISIVFVVYGVVRVFEIAVYQANVLLFDEYRAVKAGKDYALEGYRRIVLLLLHNYAEIIIWLASTYTFLADEFAHKWEAGTKTVLGGIYSSFITMTTFGDFDLLPKTDLAAIVLLFHATVGLFMTLLSLACFISLIPAPKSKDALEIKQMGSQPPNPALNRTRRKRRAG